jgi:hypothetical protein
MNYSANIVEKNIFQQFFHHFVRGIKKIFTFAAIIVIVYYK